MAAFPRRDVPDPIPCWGSAATRGAMQGAALGASVHHARAILGELEPFQLMRPRFLPTWAFRRVAEGKAAKAWGQDIATASPWADEAIRALAKAAAVSPRTLMLLHCLEPMLADIQPQTNLGGCSALALRGARSLVGPIVGRNFDYLPLVQPLYTIRATHPENGYRALEFTLSPLVGAVDGINEHGLAVTYDYAFAIDGGTAAPPLTLRVSEVLRHCRTVAEAAAHIESSPRWGGALLMMADADGDIASLEVSNTRVIARRPKADEDWLAHSNCYRTARGREIELPRDAIYTERAPEALRGVRVHDSGESREARLDELLVNAYAMDGDGVQRVLADHGPDGTPGSNTVCVHGTFWHSTCSVQAIPRERTLRVAFGNPCAETYRDFCL